MGEEPKPIKQNNLKRNKMKTLLEVIVIFFFIIGFLKVAKLIIDYIVNEFSK
jgi:hypothetical protein